jgi:hypothetical protein
MIGRSSLHSDLLEKIFLLYMLRVCQTLVEMHVLKMNVIETYL